METTAARRTNFRARKICLTLFGRPFNELLPDEMKRLRRLARIAAYYRNHAKTTLISRNNHVRRKEKIIEAMGVPKACQRCGYDRHVGVLQFHHRDPSEKDANVLTLPFAAAVKEAAKCDLVCANCHQEIHIEQHTSLPPRGRKRMHSLDPFLEMYLQLSGCTQQQITEAMANRD
jgi:hypothetical protein